MTRTGLNSRLELYLISGEQVNDKIIIDIHNDELIKEVISWIPKRIRTRSIIYVVKSKKRILLCDYLEKTNDVVENEA